MRCYNGTPDSALQAVLDESARLRRNLHSLCPAAHNTYFPVEQRWQVWVNFNPITAMHHTQDQALTEAIERLTSG